MVEAERKRPWLAALLAMLYPGLGHLYLRSWIRAIVWFGLVGSAVVVLVPSGAVQPGDGVGEAVRGLADGLAGVQLRDQLFLAAVVFTEVVDAYVLALSSSADPQAAGCPNCGKDLDEELDFCPWCSARLE